jgi:hypothetical protein
MHIPTRRLLLALLITLLLALLGCSGGNTLVPQLPTITPYPAAQQLEVQAVGSNRYKPEELTTFTTTDPPESVRDFYQEMLPQDRWSIVPTGSTLKAHRIDGCQLSELQIKTKPASNGQTHVELRLTTMFCE